MEKPESISNTPTPSLHEGLNTSTGSVGPRYRLSYAFCRTSAHIELINSVKHAHEVSDISMVDCRSSKMVLEIRYRTMDDTEESLIEIDVECGKTLTNDIQDIQDRKQLLTEIALNSYITQLSCTLSRKKFKKTNDRIRCMNNTGMLNEKINYVAQKNRNPFLFKEDVEDLFSSHIIGQNFYCELCLTTLKHRQSAIEIFDTFSVMLQEISHDKEPETHIQPGCDRRIVALVEIPLTNILKLYKCTDMDDSKEFSYSFEMNPRPIEGGDVRCGKRLTNAQKDMFIQITKDKILTTLKKCKVSTLKKSELSQRQEEFIEAVQFASDNYAPPLRVTTHFTNHNDQTSEPTVVQCNSPKH